MTATIPLERHQAVGGLPYVFAPAVGNERLGLLAVIHGQSRRAAELADAFTLRATAAGFSIVVPSFDATQHDGYQRLHGDGRPLGAADAFEETCRDVERRFGLDAAPVSLLGFSAGAQFVHRYAMAQPKRVRSLAVVAAGWYTMPDPLLAFPYGCAASEELPGGVEALSDFLRVPMRVFVGEDDVESSAMLRRSAALDGSQGLQRLARARAWVGAVDEAARERGIASNIALELLPRSSHSLRQALRRGGLVARTLAFLTSVQR